MSRAKTFLANGDTYDFSQPGRRLFRWVQKVTPEAPGASPRKPVPVNLFAEIVIDLDRRLRSGTKWSHAVCVEVRENDGMTWSAEMVRVALAEKYPQIDIVPVRNEPGGGRLPAITEVLGEKVFMQGAVSCGLADPYPTLMSWRGVTLLALGVILILSGLIADAFGKHFAEQWKSGTPPTALLATLVIAAMSTIIVQWVIANHPVLSFRKCKEKFISEGDKELREKAGYADFVEWLAARLTASPSHLVIIDNYGSLDDLSHAVLERYFEEYHESVQHCHYWIIFESERGDRVSVKALESWASGRFLRPALYCQDYLGADDRRRLAERINKPARAAFYAVKSICRPAEVDEEWIRSVVEPCLSRHANPLTLRYVYLLSLALTDLSPEHRERDSSGSLYFSWDFLADVTRERRESGVVTLDGLSRETAGMRGRVLSSMFGQTLNRLELESIRRDVERYLKPLLSSGGGSNFSVTREVATYLAAHASELDLPDPSVGKLYWAFVIAQKKNASRAFWARYVIRQILEIDVARLPDSLRDGVILKELRNLGALMCETAIRCCLFSELPELIRFTRLLSADDAASVPAHTRSLLRSAWQAYHVTGDEEVLREIVEIYVSRQQLQAETAPITNVERAFSESLTLVPELRGMLEQLLLGPEARIDSPDARDYALGRGCWAILVGAPFLTRFSVNPTSFRLFDITGVAETLDSLVEEALKRLASVDVDTSTLDVAALSTAVWCRALLLDPALLRVRNRPLITDAIFLDVGAAYLQEQMALANTAVVAINGLLSAAENVVAVAGAYIKGSRRPSAASNLLNAAMVTDTCAVALAAVWLGRHFVSELFVAIPDLETRTRSLIADVDEAIGTSLAGVAGRDLPERIGDLLHISAMVWKRFGLDRMSELATLRYVQFTFAATGVHVYEESRQAPLVSAVEPLIREQHFTGIAANLVLAACFRESTELAAIHLNHAAVLAREATFGEDLKTSLALIAALNPGTMGTEMRPILEPLLACVESGQTDVSRFIALVDDEHLEPAALHLLNAATAARDLALLRRMTDAIRCGVIGRSGSPCCDSAITLVEFIETEVATDFHKADVPQLLQSWQSKRDHWMYPSLLLDLRRAGVHDGAIVDEALQLLVRDATLDKMNTWYHLALDVAEDLLDEEAEDPAALYVRNSVERWEADESAELNMRAYGLLLRRAPYNPAYISGLAHSQQVKIKRDSTIKLPLLAAEGKFFLIFADYVNHMNVWGLPLDMSSAEYSALMRESEDGRRKWIDRWITSGRLVPEPVTARAGAVAVSGTFIILGRYLFGVPFVTDDSFQRERQQLNAKSRAALSRIVQSIETLPNIPPETKRVLREYGAAYSAPEEPRAH